MTLMPESMMLLLQVDGGGPRGWLWLLVGLLVGLLLGFLLGRR